MTNLGSLRLWPLAGGPLLLAGCMTGPTYHRPAPLSPPAAHYSELAGWSQAIPSDAAPKGDWWTLFNDPLLNELAPQVRVANQTVAQDYARYQEALAAVRAANAQLLPTLGVSGTASRARGGGATASAFNLEANASWAPDIWGKLRHQVEQNAALAQADEATLANATLSEQAALASAVVNLRVADANIALLTRTVAAYQQSLRVIAAAVQTGYKLYPPSDLLQAKTQLEAAQASLLNAGVARAQYVHAIAVLVGKNPEDLVVPAGATLPSLPAIPVGVPSTLLERRPDIAAAERTMAAQNASVGVATAAYYPNISLSGDAGASAGALGRLFSAASTIWSLGASIAETVLDFGARKAAVDEAKAAYAEAVASYRSTVLTAFQGVEDNLAALRILEQEARVLDEEVGDATRAAQIARDEYQIGTVDYTTVASAEASELSARQSALTAAQNRLLAAVNLIQNLGGGWSAGFAVVKQGAQAAGGGEAARGPGASGAAQHRGAEQFRASF